MREKAFAVLEQMGLDTRKAGYPLIVDYIELLEKFDMTHEQILKSLGVKYKRQPSRVGNTISEYLNKILGYGKYKVVQKYFSDTFVGGDGYLLFLFYQNLKEEMQKDENNQIKEAGIRQLQRH